ncbi:MAG: PEP-CTERM sorting domain-containing protein [Pseudomonadota bacterium]
MFLKNVKTWLTAVAAATCLLSAPAHAVLIDFDDFTTSVSGFAPNFFGGSEDGFSIAVDAGSMLATSSGAPFGFLGPNSGSNSLHTSVAAPSGITLTNGGTFSFTSLYAGTGFSGGLAGLTITGSLSGSVVGVDIFAPPALPNGSYALLAASNLAGLAIDTLHIAMGKNPMGPIHIDDILLGEATAPPPSVPEPQTLIIFAVGLLGFAASRKFRRA